MNTFSRRSLLCLAVILFVGGAFRFYGLTIGFPFEYHVDEWFVVNRTLEMYRLGIFQPPTFDYPSFVYYLLLAGAYVIGLFKETSLFDLYVLGRILSALFASATILIVFGLGKRFEGVGTGLLAAAFYACTVTALREAHYYTTDSANTFFIAAAIYFMLGIAAGARSRNYLYAAICIGLAAGSKYNGAFLALPFCFAHFSRSPHLFRSTSPPQALKNVLNRLRSPWLIFAGVVAMLIFTMTTPYALLRPAAFLKDLNKMSGALSHKIVEGNHHYIGTVPYWYYVENLLFWAMGPALEVAGLASLAYALWRHRRQDLLVVIWVVVYFAVVGGWLNKAVRYTLPMLPFLAVFAAAMFVSLSNHFRQRQRLKWSRLIMCFTAITLAATFLYALAYMNIYRHPHTGIQATQWAFANIPAGSSILLEGPTPHERPQVDGRQMIYPDPVFDFTAHHYRFIYLEVPKFIDKRADPVVQRAEMQEVVTRADYIVMSTRWFEGLVNSPEASPVIRDYYRSLQSGQSNFELIKEITVYPRLLGIDLRDDWAEQNFRVFDHPKVWIFKRKTPG